jgi:hypothetical protein
MEFLMILCPCDGLAFAALVVGSQMSLAELFHGEISFGELFDEDQQSIDIMGRLFSVHYSAGYHSV